MKIFAYGISIVVALLIVVTIYDKLSDDDDVWNKKIQQHKDVSDSLKTVVANLDVQVHTKDSIMLTYMNSLDKVLKELNKEAQKNRDTVRNNIANLVEMRLVYCQEMAKLDQTPVDCK